MGIRMRGLAAAALVVLGSAGQVSAASPAEVAAGLAPEVAQVVSGGSWEDGGKKGGYRAVLVAASGAGGAAQLFLEWIAAGKDGAPPAVVTSSPINEVNDLRLADATLSMEYEKPNEFTVFVEPNDPNKVSGASYTVLATVPGKYTFNLGAPPE